MSSTNAGIDVELPVTVSGSPSLSVSVSADGSSGKTSGPATQSGSTVAVPSHVPSPSVSGFVGSVPPASSSELEIPSLSSSRSSDKSCEDLPVSFDSVSWSRPIEKSMVSVYATCVISTMITERKAVLKRPFWTTLATMRKDMQSHSSYFLSLMHRLAR